MKAEYIKHMGDDLMVVNAARVSFDKQSSWDYIPADPEIGKQPLIQRKVLKEKDVKLIKYLARNNHWTPFAHPQVTMRITVPIFVANQLKRHQVGFTLNEVSRRYVDSKPEFYTPEKWYGRPENSIKQGSSSEYTLNKDLDFAIYWQDKFIKFTYQDFLDLAIEVYTSLLQVNNIAPEMARMILPQSMYTSWYWTGSLAAWARLCVQRLDSHAQKET